ncbi:MAG TPA: PAS domain-containing sensor histidine kinase [Phototrophicaceae bacterium]|nr:PAS domain-containing sensor histidine kinase [Phototrophicaceae bacterium]
MQQAAQRLPWLFPADPSLTTPQQRQKRLLNILLIPVLAALVFLFNWSGTDTGYLIYCLLNLLGVIAVYLLNRADHYLAAAVTLSTLVSETAFVNYFIKAYADAPSPEISIMRVMPALLIAYLLLPLRWMLWFAVINMIAIIASGLIVHNVSALLVTTFYFTLITTALMAIAAFSRSGYISQIEKQTRDLAENEERIRGLLEATFETIVIQKDGIILDVNPAVEDLIGYKPEEVIGRPASDFVEPPYHALLTAQAESRSTDPYEVVLRHKNGAALHAELRGKNQHYRGQPVRVVAVRDITERKHREELTVEREKVRVLQKFIGNLSHDLRTPLTVINTSIYLIDRLAKEPDRQHHQIDVLQEQAVHMQHLLEELITMSRLDKADTSDFRFFWININDPIRQVVSDQQNLALRKEQTLTCQFADKLPQVLLDVDQFKLAMKHLILNALSYTPEGGSIYVETMVDPVNVLVRVSDTGIGIAPQDIPHIFEHFYRADPARGADGGTGIGLTIARRIIEAHGGTIKVESQPGQGSTFTILLPLPPPLVSA